MTMTRRMSTTRRARIFAAAKGVCHICGTDIDGTRERWEVEHVVPYALTRDDSDENLRPAHASCHSAKTAQDVTQIAKAKRVEAKHNGAYRPKATLPGSKASKWKRTVDGRTVRRDGAQ
jgi:5-methylcytosine-specific restriction endonuclease McrA